MSDQLYSGDQLLYTAAFSALAANGTGCQMRGEPLTEGEADGINKADGISVQFPWEIDGEQVRSLARIGPDRVTVHKPVREGDKFVKFDLAGGIKPDETIDVPSGT